MKIAFGPQADKFGSWKWIGQDLVDELGPERAAVFRYVIPPCDVVIFIKFKPSLPHLKALKPSRKLVYCPVDIYGSAAEIDADWESLQQFDCIICHAASLQKYFSAYSRTALLDHHVKFTAPLPTERQINGPILWTGNAANLPPLVGWCNTHQLPEELWILTNLDRESVTSSELGFRGNSRVRIENWSPEKHREWAGLARLALDIKGTDFRARHKPPTKAFDCIASGLPFAMNADSGPAAEIASRGFQLATPDDW
ncbi:MAG: hypothetical protein KDA66_13810, partial [Planctomycetaceae bacterium]|nr:hypothetical protein [Planctomycetaceae bacterium]